MQRITQCCLNPLPPETIGSFRPFSLSIVPRCLDFLQWARVDASSTCYCVAGSPCSSNCVALEPCSPVGISTLKFWIQHKTYPHDMKRLGMQPYIFPWIMESQVKQHCGFGLVAWTGEQFTSVFHWQLFYLSAYIEVEKACWASWNERIWQVFASEGLNMILLGRYRRPQFIAGWKQESGLRRCP